MTNLVLPQYLKEGEKTVFGISDRSVTHINPSWFVAREWRPVVGTRFYNSAMLTISSDLNNPTICPFDTKDAEIDQEAMLTLPDGSVQISKADVYVITFDIAIGKLSTSTRTESVAWVEIDNGPGFEEVLGSRGYGYHRTVAQGDDTISGTIIKQMTQDSVIKIVAARDSGGGSLEYIAESCAITITQFSVPDIETGFAIASEEWVPGDRKHADFLFTSEEWTP